MARCVWALVDEDITEHMAKNMSSDARQWLFAMMDSLDNNKFTMMLVTLWLFGQHGEKQFMKVCFSPRSVRLIL
jgi:hypothetical protein